MLALKSIAKSSFAFLSACCMMNMNITINIYLIVPNIIIGLLTFLLYTVLNGFNIYKTIFFIYPLQLSHKVPTRVYGLSMCALVQNILNTLHFAN